MKYFFILFLFLFNQNIFCAENILKYPKENFNSFPTEVIIYVDSILFANENLTEELNAKLLYYQALAYKFSSNNLKSISKLKQIKASKTDYNFNVKVLLALSSSNTALQNYTLAVNQGLKALEITKLYNLESQKTKALNTLSYVHYSIKEYEKALFYLSESVKLSINNKDSLELSSIYNNMAILQKNTGNFEEAILLNYKSLEISTLINDNIGIGKSYCNIGRVYDLLGDKEKTLSFFKKADEHNKNFNISNSIPIRNMADYYFNAGKLLKSEEKYLEAIKIEREKDNTDVKYNLYDNLLRLAIQTNNFEKALYYQTIVDSLYLLNTKSANEKNIRNIEAQYKLQANEKSLIQEKKNNDKNKLIFIILFCLLILLILFLYQKNKSAKLKLSEEKLMLEQQILRSQMNPHFIFNALSAIQSSLLNNEPIQSASYLSKFAILIRQNFDFINCRKIFLFEEIDALQNYMDTQKMRFEDKFNYEINICDDVDVNIVQIPPLLLQPFIENAIEHGFKNLKKEGLITLNIYRNKNYICYEIIDNGIGYDTEKNSDDKKHAIDVFKKRLKLLANNDFSTFSIKSNNDGTLIKFCLQE